MVHDFTIGGKTTPLLENEYVSITVNPPNYEATEPDCFVVGDAVWYENDLAEVTEVMGTQAVIDVGNGELLVEISELIKYEDATFLEEEPLFPDVEIPEDEDTIEADFKIGDCVVAHEGNVNSVFRGRLIESSISRRWLVHNPVSDLRQWIDESVLQDDYDIYERGDKVIDCRLNSGGHVGTVEGTTYSKADGFQYGVRFDQKYEVLAAFELTKDQGQKNPDDTGKPEETDEEEVKEEEKEEEPTDDIQVGDRVYIKQDDSVRLHGIGSADQTGNEAVCVKLGKGASNNTYICEDGTSRWFGKRKLIRLDAVQQLHSIVRRHKLQTRIKYTKKEQYAELYDPATDFVYGFDTNEKKAYFWPSDAPQDYEVGPFIRLFQELEVAARCTYPRQEELPKKGKK